MAKKAYIGVDAKARKIKKGYIGVDGVSRKIKKAYIGIGDVARPCWTGGELTYYGAITGLSSARTSLSAVTVKNKALFAGGSISGTTQTSVDAYDSSLTRRSASALSKARANIGGASVGNYAVFCGGRTAGGYNTQVNTVDAYDSDLTKVSVTALATAKQYVSAGSVGGYAVVGGGYLGYYNSPSYTVETYDEDLTRTSVSTNLSYPHSFVRGISSDNRFYIGGGLDATGSSDKNRTEVESYDANLTKTVGSLSFGSELHMPTSNGTHAIFAGGYQRATNKECAYVCAVDEDMVCTTLANLAGGRQTGAGVRLGDFALICGGETNAGVGSKVTDVYDASLTKGAISNMTTTMNNCGGTSIDDYAFIAGTGSSTEVYALM